VSNQEPRSAIARCDSAVRTLPAVNFLVRALVDGHAESLGQGSLEELYRDALPHPQSTLLDSRQPGRRARIMDPTRWPHPTPRSPGLGAAGALMVPPSLLSRADAIIQ